MLDFIAIPMGTILKFTYDNLAFQNYGVAIVFFTVGVKTLLLPFTIRQVQASSKMGDIQPQVQEIQNKYKDDREKQNEEIMKLYQENNMNPTGGCLPTLIQMPILFSLYYVISQPLKYMLGKSPEVITQLYEMIPEGTEKIARMRDLNIITYFSNHPEKLESVSDLLKPADLLNMSFLGINLGVIPSSDPSHYINGVSGIETYLLLLIPILAAITSYISVSYSMKVTSKKDETQRQPSMQNNMAMISPIMSGMISFTVPAGLGLYWIVGNVYQIVQQLFINLFIVKKQKQKTAAVDHPERTIS